LPSGKYCQGLGWNFPEASRNRSPAFPRKGQPAGFGHFPLIRLPAWKPYERLRESPHPARFNNYSEFPDGNKLIFGNSISAAYLGDCLGRSEYAPPLLNRLRKGLFGKGVVTENSSFSVSTV